MIRELFLGDFLLSSCVWQSTIFIMVGLVGSFILRHRSSRAHQVLFLAMIAAVIVPIMSILVKHYELGMFVAEPVAIQSPAEDLTGGSNYGAPGIISAENIEHNPGLIEKDLPSALAGSESAEFPLRSIVLYGWLAASLILATRLLVTFVLGVRLLGRALPLDCQRIEEALNLAKAKLGIDKDVMVRSSRGVRSPVIWCWRLRPILLVPSAAGRFDNGIDWAGVLCHELAHYKRRDHICGLLAELAVCILPWHPLLWWAKSRLVRLSEQACDDWVVASGQPSTDYAESLLDLIPGGQMAFVPAVVSSKRGLAGRVRRILKDSCGNPRTGAIWALAVSIAALCLAVGVACAQTRPAKPETPTERADKSTKSLHQAAADGDIEQVKSLISKGADVNEKDPGGKTALHCASEKGHTEVAKLLISQGAYVNAIGWKMTPLHFAAMSGDKKTVELLLSKGADINAKDRYGRTPLFEAMKSSAAGCKEVVKFLVSKGSKVPEFHLAAYLGDTEKLKKCLQDGMDINSQEDFCCTALHLAANSGKKDIVEFLISKGAKVDARDALGLGVTPLYYAAMHNYEDIADLLLAKGADVNAKNKDRGECTLLYYAVWDHSKDTIKLLISKGADVNVKDDAGYTPLVYAIWEDDKDMVELLISKGADVNAEDNDGLTPYYWAAMQGSKDLVELLTAKGATPVFAIPLAAREGDLTRVKRFIEEGADVNMYYKGAGTPLFAAVLADSDDVAKFLIAKGADVNVKDNAGVTPLNFVIRSRGKKDMVELLISKGADVNAKNNRGVTPLHSACVRGQKDVAELLIVKGAELNAKITGDPAVGWTPLHFACFIGHKDVAEVLIAKGADIDIKDNNSRTPLHEACLRGHKDVAELLIAKGADMNAKDNKEQTALSLAKEQGHDEIVKLLRKHGVKE